MPQNTTFRVRTERACTGRGGYYELLMHRIPRTGQPQLERVSLAGDCAEVEQQVGFSELVTPADILQMLQRRAARVGAARIPPAELVTASLVRRCTRPHQSGLQRSAPEGRPEAVFRRVWLPAAVGAPALKLTGDIDLNKDGIGEVAIPIGENESLLRPALSVPLTPQESSAGSVLAVPVTGNTDAAHSIYALLHPVGERQVLEQVLRAAA